MPSATRQLVRKDVSVRYRESYPFRRTWLTLGSTKFSAAMPAAAIARITVSSAAQHAALMNRFTRASRLPGGNHCQPGAPQARRVATRALAIRRLDDEILREMARVDRPVGRKREP